MKHVDMIIDALADVADEADRRGLTSEADELGQIIELISKIANNSHQKKNKE